MKKTTIKQKAGLIILSIILTLIILECGLRMGGFIFLSLQRYENRITGGIITEGDRTYRILCLGESTTAGLSSSWHAQLEVILNERIAKIKFEVFNEGIGGTNTAFILAGLKENLDKYKPDMVITMMGLNDELFGPSPVRYKENLRTNLILLFEDLRVYKLSKFLLAAWENKRVYSGEGMNKQFVNKNEDEAGFEDAVKMYKKAIEIDQNNDYLYTQLGRVYRKEGRFEEAEEMLKKAIEINPNNDDAYNQLGWVYYREGKIEDAVEALKKNIKINQSNDEAYTNLGWVYYGGGNLKDAMEMYKKSIRLNQDNDMSYLGLGMIYRDLNISDKEIEKFYEKGGFSFIVSKDSFSFEIIRYHYQQLHKILSERRIKHIAMQYPTRSIDELKAIFEKDEKVIFVSNKENFKKALETGAYEDYFIDNFAGKFGHCTFKGNKLIAENVANIVLKELKINTENEQKINISNYNNL